MAVAMESVCRLTRHRPVLQSNVARKHSFCAPRKALSASTLANRSSRSCRRDWKAAKAVAIVASCSSVGGKVGGMGGGCKGGDIGGVEGGSDGGGG